MSKNKRYHGWIYQEKSQGFKDHFSVQWKDEKGQSIIRHFGYGEAGASEAVAHFEETLGLGHIQLEATPLGLRVYTQ